MFEVKDSTTVYRALRNIFCTELYMIHNTEHEKSNNNKCKDTYYDDTK